MITKVLNLIIQTKDTDKNLGKTNDNIEDINKNLNKTEKELKDVNKEGKKTKDIKGGFDKAKKGIGGFTSGIKKMGFALKAAGIGLLIASFAKLKEIFETNQSVVDAQSTAFESLKIVFSEVASAIGRVTTAVAAARENFDALGKVLLNVLKIAIVPMRIQFQSIKSVIIGAQLAWESSFFGGQDEKRIAELKQSLVGVKDEIINIGLGAFESGKQIVNNIGEAVEEAGDIATTVVEEVSKVNVKTAIATAKSNTALKKSAELLAVENQGLIEKYDRQAEQQRQIRDDERLTLTERLKANEKLGNILNKQETKMLANAKIALQVADNELKINSDNQAALVKRQEALNEIAAIEAQVDGFRSEQKTNQAALERELLELNQTAIDATDERAVAEAEFNASTKENALLRLEAEAEAIELEKRLGEKRLEDKRNQFTQGTQEFADANQELLTFQQEIGFKQIENEIAINTEIDRIENEALEKTKAKRQQDLDNLKAINEAKLRSQEALVAATSSSLNSIAQLAGEGTEIGKAAALADVFINTASGISSAISGATAAAAATGPGAPIMTPLLIAQLVGQVLGGMAAAKNILKKVKGPSASVPSSVSTGGRGGGGSRPPQFNIVGNSGVNQIANAVGSQGPVQAFVVAGAVTTQQQLNNAIVSRATL